MRNPAATNRVNRTGAAQTESRQSVIHFVAACEHVEHSVVTKVHNVPAPTPIVSKPTIVPPLSIADYENYIKSDSIGVHSKARPATLPAPPQSATKLPASITTVELAKRPRPATEAQPRRDIVVAAPLPVHEAPHTADNAQKKKAATTSAQIHQPRNLQADGSTKPKADSKIYENSPAIGDSHPTNSRLASEPNSDSNTTLDQSELRVAKVSPINVAHARDTDDRVAVLAQTPATPTTQPTPAESKIEGAPISTESIPIIVADGLSMPMTTSSYLPAHPESYCFRYGVKCPPCGCNPGGPGWAASRPIPWEVFAQGEYVGPARLAHVPVYRLRVDDRLALVYRLSGQVSGLPYRLNVPRSHLGPIAVCAGSDQSRVDH